MDEMAHHHCGRIDAHDRIVHVPDASAKLVSDNFNIAAYLTKAYHRRLY
jgi:hypothetical protein